MALIEMMWEVEVTGLLPPTSLLPFSAPCSQANFFLLLPVAFSIVPQFAIICQTIMSSSHHHMLVSRKPKGISPGLGQRNYDWARKSQIPLHQSVSDRELRMRLRKLLNNGAARMGGRRTIFTFAIVQAPRVSCCPVSLGIQKQLHLLSLSSSDSMLLFIFGCLAQCLIR